MMLRCGVILLISWYRPVSIFDLALQLFLITNPIGNAPAILALVRKYDFQRQKSIVLRESFFALLLALFFQFVGEPFLDALGIQDYALSMCGGTLILLSGLQMIFPHHEEDEQAAATDREPYLVPIATPLLSGAGLLTYIMIFSKKLDQPLEMTGAILICFAGVFLVMWAAPYLMRTFGKRGMQVLEQIMGLVLSMIAIEMVVKGVALFMGGI